MIEANWLHEPVGLCKFNATNTMRLFWITENGNEWLVERTPSANSPEELNQIVAEYVERTKEDVSRIVEGWRRNGEDVSLYPCGEGDCIGETHAISKAFDLLDTA
jgi:hypothetical protein